MKWATTSELNILSQLFVSLAAGWFGLVLITPGIADLTSLEGIEQLIKNLLFGIVSLYIAMKISDRSK